jgi:methylmalonyl-CoA/ethylmalonyl-CoA epimerase
MVANRLNIAASAPAAGSRSVLNLLQLTMTSIMNNISNIVSQLEFAQISYVVPNIHTAVKFLSASLGIAFPKPELVRAHDVNMTYYGKMVPSECLTTQAYNGTYLEIIQPTSGQSMFSDYLARHPEGGVQHHAFRLPVDGFEHVKKNLLDQGYAVVSEVDHPIARMIFFDTYKDLGVVTEIMGITPEGWKILEPMEKSKKK